MRPYVIQPLPLLFGRLLQPLSSQLFALIGRQLLETLESLMQLLLFLGWQGVVQMLVLTRLLALLGRHLLPALDAFTDFLLAFRRQLHPVLRALDHVLLPFLRQRFPLRLQRAKQVLLLRAQAAPRMRALRVRRRRDHQTEQKNQQRWQTYSSWQHGSAFVLVAVVRSKPTVEIKVLIKTGVRFVGFRRQIFVFLWFGSHHLLAIGLR